MREVLQPQRELELESRLPLADDTWQPGSFPALAQEQQSACDELARSPVFSLRLYFCAILVVTG